MKIIKQFIYLLMLSLILLTGCSTGENGTDVQTQEQLQSQGQTQSESRLSKIDMTKWQYNKDTDVYWQVGIVYCETPADENYENLGIYVPSAYMTGVENGDGTYTCEIDPDGTVGGFTADTAPIVIPVDTPGYSAMAAPTGYVDGTSVYTDAGFVYVYAGCRGRDAGAPAGVTDLKAAVRYIRYVGDMIPGSTDRIFSFGMSGGGGQSALIGATGDSDLYTPYLEAIGAVSGVSDAVEGSMCWCPITNLDYASEAYEWNLGVTRTGLSGEMQELSDEMAEQFALYINDLGLTDENGNVLALTVSEEGIYQAGSYYDHLKNVIETSLNNFLADTDFPYDAAAGERNGFGGHGGFGGFPRGTDGGFGGLPGGTDDGGFGVSPEGGTGGGFGGFPEGEGGGTGGDFGGLGGKDGMGMNGGADGGKFPNGDGAKDGLPDMGNIEDRDNINRNEVSGGISLNGTYETAQDYIDALNGEKVWVSYDASTNTAAITNIADFVNALKIASKDLGAFDALDKSQGENILFGYGGGAGAHFDALMAELLAENAQYGAAYAEDLARTDALGTSVADRVNMYNPLYYLSEYYDGYKTSKVAPCWRIRTGINQSDTALTTEVNLALALENYGADVDFETVWGQAHVEAERTGSSTENFIVWVVSCCQ